MVDIINVTRALRRLRINLAGSHLDQQSLLDYERVLQLKYDGIVAGKIEYSQDNGKVIVVIECPECHTERRIATSDLFQVTACEKCTVTARNARRRTRRKSSAPLVACL